MANEDPEGTCHVQKAQSGLNGKPPLLLARHDKIARSGAGTAMESASYDSRITSKRICPPNSLYLIMTLSI